MPAMIVSPSTVLHASGRRRGRGSRLPVRLFRILVQAWLNGLERRIHRSFGKLDRAGLLDNDTPASVSRTSAQRRPVETPLDSAAAIR